MLSPTLAGQFAALAGVPATGGTFTGAVTFSGAVTCTGGFTSSVASGYAATLSGDPTSPVTPLVALTPMDAVPSGAAAVGDVYTTTTGLARICNAAGTPGTFINLNELTPLVSTDKTLAATDHKRIFVIDDNAADITLTVPTTLPLGFLFYVVCNSTTKKITVQLSGSERVRYGGSTSGAGGTIYWDGTTDTGYCMTLAKTSAGFANTYWVVLTTVGAPHLT